jgi:LemA protein
MLPQTVTAPGTAFAAAHGATLAMSAGTVALAVLLSAGAVALWVMVAFNALASRRVRVQNGFAQIDVQLRRRHDLVPNLVAAVKGAMAHERSTLEAVTQARAAAVGAQARVAAAPGDAAATAALAGAESALAGALGRLLALMERYPDLKAGTNALQLQEELVSTENRIAFARQAYNDAVTSYNTRLAVFPDMLVARWFGFVPAALFESDGAARAVPAVDMGAGPAR